MPGRPPCCHERQHTWVWGTLSWGLLAAFPESVREGGGTLRLGRLRQRPKREDGGDCSDLGLTHGACTQLSALLFTQWVSELLTGLTQDVNVASVEYWLMFQTARLYQCLCSGQSEPWLGPSTAWDGCLSRPASPRALRTSAPALHCLEGPPAGTWWSGQDSEEGTWAWRRGVHRGSPRAESHPQTQSGGRT